ncbi:MAG: hypothetical protein HGJ94_08735 [Desulfosarcina sp.]|nr:hypothetical protein [Desulfosarcina sp.]
MDLAPVTMTPVVTAALSFMTNPSIPYSGNHPFNPDSLFHFDNRPTLPLNKSFYFQYLSGDR